MRKGKYYRAYDKKYGFFDTPESVKTSRRRYYAGLIIRLTELGYKMKLEDLLKFPYSVREYLLRDLEDHKRAVAQKGVYIGDNQPSIF